MLISCLIVRSPLFQTTKSEENNFFGDISQKLGLNPELLEQEGGSEGLGGAAGAATAHTER